MNLLTRHFRQLLTFDGRENREPFWLWVLALYIAQTVISFVAMIPIMVRMFQNITYMAETQHPGQQPDSNAMFGMIQPMMTTMGALGAVLGLMLILLASAAVVRRLHDSDRRGWWALPTLILHVAGQAAGLALLARGRLVIDPHHPYANFGAGIGSIQILGFLALIFLAVLLALPGTDGVNRFGEDPLPR
ncbi:MAG: DUF805 domain-containing protein [Pseudomonadota bacterium]|nr:DUF805 domain-containing protein [Pseudomonadota bacterium]